MKKWWGLSLIVFLCVGMVGQAALAGGIDNKQNFSARYIATGNRNAALDGADIAAYNPAGIVHGQNGVMFEADVQGLFKVYENRYVSAFDGHVMKEQDNPSPVPGLFATYKKDNLGSFFSFTINGGGGDVDYGTGNALTDTIERSLAPQVMSQEFLEADSYYLTWTTGVSYALNDVFSVAVGGRYIYAERNVDAYASMSISGDLIAAYEEEADGFGYIASLNIRPSESFLIALRYESIVELEFETTFENNTNGLGTTILGSLGKTNGGKGDRDLPAVLGAGIRWQPSDWLVLESSFTYYFEEDADWDNKVSNVDNSYDVGISATFSVTDDFRFSLGYLRTDVGIDPSDYSLIEKISPILDAHSIFVGMGFDFTDRISVEFGAMHNIYDVEKDESSVNGVEYSKYNTGVAIGVICKI